MAELDEKYADVIVKRYLEQKGSGEDVSVIRNGMKIGYCDLEKEEDADEAVDLP